MHSKKVCLVLAIAFGIALAGCGERVDDEAHVAPLDALDEEDLGPAPGDRIVFHMMAEMDHLNPYTSSDASESTVNAYIFEGLLERNPETLDMEPRIAESWDICEEYLEYTFYLRDDVRFSDGEPLTAEDVVFSFETVLDPEVMAPHLRNYYADIEEVELVDDYTVRFTCSQPYFRHLIMIGGLPILPKHIYGEGDFNDHPKNRSPVGSGPYVFHDWRTGQRVTLRRNENYWKEKPYIEERVFLIITEPNSAFQILNRQDMDVMELTPELWRHRASRSEFQQRFNRYTYYAPRYSYIGYNMRRSIFEDKRVRRAMTMLIDRKEFLEHVHYDLGQVITGNFFIKNPEYNEEIEPWPYDPDGALELLAEVGWERNDHGFLEKDGQEFRFELIIRADSPTDEQIATVFQESLRRAGIRLRIRRLEWASLLQQVDSRDFDAVRLGWSMPPDPDPFQVWHSSQSERGSNHVGFVNEEADAIIEEARQTFDDEHRTELYRRFHEIVHEEQPYTFLFCMEVLLAVDNRFHGITIYPYGPDSREWYVPAPLQRYLLQ